MDISKFQNSYRMWTNSVMEINEARSKINQFCEMDSISRTDRENLELFISRLEPWENDVPYLHSPIKKGKAKLSGTLLEENALEDNDEIRVQITNNLRKELTASLFLLPFSDTLLEEIVKTSITREWKNEITTSTMTSGLRDCVTCVQHQRLILVFSAKFIEDLTQKLDQFSL
eukprot:TRINITY_DN13443_c0_g4_i2.p1 TRINITY_DN13443_c0_g4~~TRINITY_DN13443_c0_g4_i2.p1  ORF type:complete len:173 (-),score=31.08 TRINITY_DN13443_c0_g4_i2:891-1409(-)